MNDVSVCTKVCTVAVYTGVRVDWSLYYRRNTVAVYCYITTKEGIYMGTHIYKYLCVLIRMYV